MIQAVLDGESDEDTLSIIDNLDIYDGLAAMGITDTQTLSIKNKIGNVTWSSSDETVLTVDSYGTVTAENIGTAKIIAQDEAGGYDEFEISVNVVVAKPEIPEDINASFMRVKLVDNGNGEWYTDTELPLTDGQGNTYYYYIAELDSNGAIAESIRTNNGVYVPINYDKNGFVLVEDDTVTASVTNKLTETIEGQMPSTGGEGTRTYYIYGIIMMLCGIAGFTVLKLRRGRRS